MSGFWGLDRRVFGRIGASCTMFEHRGKEGKDINAFPSDNYPNHVPRVLIHPNTFLFN
jgi:hypothetical protein